MAITTRILVKIILMIVLGRIEIIELCKFYGRGCE